VDVIVKRCAGLDVAKAGVAVCVRIFDEERGSWTLHRRTFATTVGQILQLRDWLVSFGVTRVGMESTSDYWRPLYYLLEPDRGRGWDPGWQCWLVNARHAKNVPGRKTDLSDAEWLSQLLAHGLVRPSFVPEPAQRTLRELTRRREVVLAARTREKQRLEKFLESTGLKLSSVLSDLFGVSGRAILTAILSGQRDPGALAQLARGRARAKTNELMAAVTGIRFGDHEAFLARQHLDLIDHYTMITDEIDARIMAHIAEHDAQPEPVEPEPLSWREAVDLIDTAPGLDRIGACAVMAEIGTDMTRFPTPEHLASWAGVAPGNNATGGKTRPARTRPGNPHLRRILGVAAMSAARRPGSYAQALYRRIAARRGTARALVAVEHHLLVAIWHMTTKREPYAEPAPRPVDTQRRARRLLTQLHALGYDVTIAHPAAAAS
jgi:transposase